MPKTNFYFVSFLGKFPGEYGLSKGWNIFVEYFSLVIWIIANSIESHTNRWHLSRLVLEKPSVSAMT